MKTGSRSFAQTIVLPGMLVEYRRVLTVAMHLVLIWLANLFAFWLRFDGDIPAWAWTLHLQMLPWLLAVRGLIFIPYRMYQGLWRYTGLWDLFNIMSAVATSTVVFAVLSRLLAGSRYPRSVYFIDALLLLCGSTGLRLTKRILNALGRQSEGKRVLIYGAGDAGEMLDLEMGTHAEVAFLPGGFIDDDETKRGERIHGVPVLGTRHDVARMIAEKHPDEILVAIPKADMQTFRTVVRSLDQYAIPIKTLPNFRDILDNKIEIDQIRDLSVQDLLSRGAIDLDQAPTRALLEGRRILVTGAGGSVGAELCRQIVAFSPSLLVAFDRSEAGLFNVANELADRRTAVEVRPIIGDVTDRSRVRAVMAEIRPDIVFHAAAYKHVPMMESNACEAVKNNVAGTRIVVEAAEEFAVDRFVLVSTDKAVNPTSVMGATKRVSELMLQTHGEHQGTTFVIVRFGNVLGSSGSVVPRFLQQIRAGGPITVTHPAMRRFFMLIPEAVQLVLHAAALGENRRLYALDMGEQVKLVDLARDLVRLTGHLPGVIPITFIGLRPGEKLFEELVGQDETAFPSPGGKVMVIKPDRLPDRATLVAKVDGLEAAARAGDRDGVMAGMRDIVPTFADAPVQPLDLESEPVVEELRAKIGRRQSSEDPMLERGQACPDCGSNSVHRSRAMSPIENMRKSLTYRRPYRCRDCGWRGWLVPLAHLGGPVPGSPLEALLDPNLEAVDESILAGARTARREFSPPDLQPDTNTEAKVRRRSNA